MKRFLITILILLWNQSYANDLEPAAIEAAKRYMEAANLGALWDSMVSEHSATLSEADRREYLASSESRINIVKFEEIMLDGLVTVFTVEELNALADFYGSSAGQSALAKYGKFSAYISPRIAELASEGDFTEDD